MKIIILIPIYNDWQSATKLLDNINNEVMLRSLHRLFEPIFPSRIRGAEKTTWDYI